MLPLQLYDARWTALSLGVTQAFFRAWLPELSEGVEEPQLKDLPGWASCRGVQALRVTPVA